MRKPAAQHPTAADLVQASQELDRPGTLHYKLSALDRDIAIRKRAREIMHARIRARQLNLPN